MCLETNVRWWRLCKLKTRSSGVSRVFGDFNSTDTCDAQNLWICVIWINTNEKDHIWARCTVSVNWTHLVDLTTLGGWMRASVTRYWWAARRHALAVPWNEEKLGRDGHCLLARPWNHTSDWIKTSRCKIMAKNTSLYFRIVEGRNLPAKDV